MSAGHWINVKVCADGSTEWVCVSHWTYDIPGRRYIGEQQRATRYTDEKSARRWARRYKVPFPEVPR